MRYAVLSDIHANWEALDAVVKACRRDAVDAYVCAGDVVGYGADPAACLGWLRREGVPCVAGNHDWVLSGQVDPDRFNMLARKAAVWTEGQLNEEDKAFLAGLPLEYRNEDFMVVHGALPCPERFDYLNTLSKAEAMLDCMDRPVCFAGHTHVPWIVGRQEDRVVDLRTDHVIRRPSCRYIVNVGSVGQSRDGDPRAAYCIFDTDEGSIAIKRTAYPVEKAQEKILRAGLPAGLAGRLARGV